MIKVSIIIPVYKVEPYIVRCVDSVLRQTYRHLEVILVDDCSPDRSMQLAQEYIEQSLLSKDLQFAYLKHDCNRGLSAARNTGMDAATGEYVFFLDSDDEITVDCVELLTKPLEDNNYDLVVGNYKNIGKYEYYQPIDFTGEIVGQEKIAQSYYDRKWYPMAWNKLSSLEYLRGNGLYFQEGLIHEDELWSYQLALTAKKICGVKSVTYLYIIRDNSIITANDPKKSERKINNYLKVLKGMYQFQEDKKIYRPIVWDLQRTFRNCVSRTMLSGGYTLYETYKKIRENDIRSTSTMLKMYPSLRDKIVCFDTFLPCKIGYIYRRMLRKYFAWRNHDNKYPFYSW